MQGDIGAYKAELELCNSIIPRFANAFAWRGSNSITFAESADAPSRSPLAPCKTPRSYHASTSAPFLQRCAAINVGLGHRLQLDRTYEVANRAVIIALTLSHQSATEVGSAIVAIEFDGPVEMGQRGFQVSCLQLSGAAFQVINCQTSIELRVPHKRADDELPTKTNRIPTRRTIGFELSCRQFK